MIEKRRNVSNKERKREEQSEKEYRGKVIRTFTYIQFVPRRGWTMKAYEMSLSIRSDTEFSILYNYFSFLLTLFHLFTSSLSLVYILFSLHRVFLLVTVTFHPSKAVSYSLRCYRRLFYIATYLSSSLFLVRHGVGEKRARSKENVK